MFLKKLFGFDRDYKYWQEKGDGLLKQERFADARDALGEAMGKMEAAGVADASLLAAVRDKYAEAGNRLGRLNLDEAGYALARGDREKAGEHLRMVMDLADDADLRKEAAELLAGMTDDATPEKTDSPHSCSGCSDTTRHTGDEGYETDDALHMEDRFDLYIHTLPCDLPERYRDLGEEFAQGCLMSLGGRGEEALGVFAGLSAAGENDIIAYETALIFYRKGDLAGCEKALRRSIEINGMNPLGYFSLVQLMGETGRIAEALPFLQLMINNELLPDQARLLLGEAHILLGDEESAMDCYSGVLSSKGYAQEAAMKLIPLLEKRGRREDAAYLAKKFKKGCC
ncbi:MAG TPA: hypothetical protein VMJ66_11980 [Geobacteraceae bacterium]|nr:hypothetical protein [Geobacteraceae bacterium]